MTVCGLVRLDGSDARRSTLTSMLAASRGGLPAARTVHLDGPFGVVTAPGARSLPMPPVVACRDGLVVVLDGVTPVGLAPVRAAPLRAAPVGAAPVGLDPVRAAPVGPAPVGLAPVGVTQVGGTVLGGTVVGGTETSVAAGTDAARRLAAEFRDRGERCLVGRGAARIVMVWEPRRRRLVVSRGGRAAEEVLIWSDGQIFAFGTEAVHLVAAGLPRVSAVGAIGRQSRGTRLASVRRLAAGEHVSVTVTASRPRRGRRVLRLVRPLGEPAG